jgi:phosphoglycerate dehydrogenase-like enzyme
MKLLIVNKAAAYIKAQLEPKFPRLMIYAACLEGEGSDSLKKGSAEYEKFVKFVEEAQIFMAIRFPDELMQRAGNIQWFHCMITGVDLILALPSLREGVILTSAKGIHGPQMSELAILLMLNLTRKYTRILRNQKKRAWVRRPQSLLYKKSVGILGVGVIGKEIARKCKAFDMTVHGITSKKREIEYVDHSYGPEELIEVLRTVDYFINVIPNTPETRNIIGEKEFRAMKPTAFFINIGRGETTNEEALVQALKEGRLAGAGLDVFCEEPLPEKSPFWDLDNVLITPHVGGLSDIYADQVLPVFEENLRRYLKGERKNLINRVEWKKN